MHVASAQSDNALTIAFGSCNKETLPQNYWEIIQQHNPDLWVWLGDNIYGDSYDTSVLANKYALQKNNPYYASFTAAVPIIGTWDDHDFGVNDGGKDFAAKDLSKELFMRFFNVPADDPMRSRGGVYDAYPIEKNGIAVQVIMLDTRYFRDILIAEYRNGDKYYLPNTNGDILGEEQWQWLEKTLQQSKADVIVLGSSIQVLAEQHRFEKWSNFPNARQRLLNIIAKYNRAPIIIISGDRHIAEVSKMEIKGNKNMLYDITSSGLTHTWGQQWEEENPFRISDLYIAKNFGVLHFNRAEGVVHVQVEIFNTENTLLYAKQLF